MWDIIVILGFIFISVISCLFYHEARESEKASDACAGFFCGLVVYAILVGIFFLFKCAIIPHTGLKVLYGLIPFVIIPIGCNLDKLKFRIKLEKK